MRSLDDDRQAKIPPTDIVLDKHPRFGASLSLVKSRPALPPIQELTPLQETDLANWIVVETGPDSPNCVKQAQEQKERPVSFDQQWGDRESDASAEGSQDEAVVVISPVENFEKEFDDSDETSSFRSVVSAFPVAPVVALSAFKEPREERCIWSTPPNAGTLMKADGRPRDSFVRFMDLIAKASTHSSFYSPLNDERARRGRRFHRPTLKARCCLLELPPELRNRIYVAVFPLHCEKQVSPFDINNPELNLLLSCRQIYIETRKLYEDARRYLWMNSHFYIKSPDIKPPDLRGLNAKDLDLITHATVRIDSEGVVTLANLIDHRGGWKVDYVNTRPGQGGPGVPGGVRTEYVCVHQRPSGHWQGMTWTEFHQSEDSMDASLGRMVARTGAHAGVRDQLLQLLLVTPRDVERVAVRSCWRSVFEPS